MMKVNMEEACLAEWENLKMKKASRYLVFNISDKEEIVVEKVGPR
jgi:hypothetical protein